MDPEQYTLGWDKCNGKNELLVVKWDGKSKSLVVKWNDKNELLVVRNGKSVFGTLNNKLNNTYI